MECDGTPVVNGKVTIGIRYDSGMFQSEEIATTYTDGNGDFSVVADISYSGTFETYTFSLTSGTYSVFAIPNSGNSGSSNDVHCDLPVGQSGNVNLHFKNSQPVDTSDLLIRLYTSNNVSSQTDSSLELNLQGTIVDTIITKSYPVERRYYKYSCRKNGVTSFSPVSSFDVECGSAVNVDIFY